VTIAYIPNSSNRHCRELGHNAHGFPKEAQVPDFKVFWRWTLDRYKRIDAGSSVKNYWRVLRMYILDKADRDFDQSKRRYIHNVRCLSLRVRKVPR